MLIYFLSYLSILRNVLSEVSRLILLAIPQSDSSLSISISLRPLFQSVSCNFSLLVQRVSFKHFFFFSKNSFTTFSAAKMPTKKKKLSEFYKILWYLNAYGSIQRNRFSTEITWNEDKTNSFSWRLIFFIWYCKIHKHRSAPHLYYVIYKRIENCQIYTSFVALRLACDILEVRVWTKQRIIIHTLLNIENRNKTMCESYRNVHSNALAPSLSLYV